MAVLWVARGAATRGGAGAAGAAGAVVRTSDEGAVLTKATIRAADRLGLSQKTLANVIGLSQSVVSRMRSGDYVLERGKAFELAALFVRLYRSLDAIVSGDEKTAREWMKNQNLALRGCTDESDSEGAGFGGCHPVLGLPTGCRLTSDRFPADVGKSLKPNIKFQR